MQTNSIRFFAGTDFGSPDGALTGFASAVPGASIRLGPRRRCRVPLTPPVVFLSPVSGTIRASFSGLPLS